MAEWWTVGGEVLIGALVTFLAGLGIYNKQRRDNRRKLRIALKHEIDGMKGPIKGYAGAMSGDNDISQHKHVLPETNFITTFVYENNTQNIGLLSEEEVDSVVTFYASAIQTKRGLEMLQNHENPTNTATYHGLRNNGLENLKTKNNRARRILEERLDSSESILSRLL